MPPCRPTDLTQGGRQGGEASPGGRQGAGLGDGEEGPLRRPFEHAADSDGAHASDLNREGRVTVGEAAARCSFDPSEIGWPPS